VDKQSELIRQFSDLGHVFGCEERSTATIVRVLQAEQPAAWVMRVSRISDDCSKVVQPECAVLLVLHCARVDATYGSRSSRLEQKGMSQVTHDRLITPLAVRQEAN
jgi:hypothetical protein